jgi:uncharacterized protein YlxP (DUF503 family)
MAAIVLLVTLHLFEPSSLKDKRAVVRPVVERLRRQLSVSVAEVGLHDDLRRSEIGLALVATDLGEARRLLEQAQHAIDDLMIGRGEVIDAVVEELTLDSELT